MYQKTLLTGSILVVLSNPYTVNAASLVLTTVNNTDDYSSVYITHRGCAPKSTAPHSRLDTPLALAKTICLKTSGFCEATLYPSNNCSGTPQAVLQMDLSNAHVTITQRLDNKYVITAENTESGSIVTVGYSS